MTGDTTTPQAPFTEDHVTCTTWSRDLSASESYLHQLTGGEDRLMTLVTVGRLQSPTPLPTHLIRTSLHLLSHRHRLLQSTIVKTPPNGDLVFQPMESSHVVGSDWIVLKDVEVEDVGDWNRVAEEEFRKGFVEGEVLWRVVVLRALNEQQQQQQYAYTLIFVCHHCILDGLGAYDMIANQLLPIMNCTMTEKSIDTLPKPLPMLKSFAEIFFGFTGTVSSQVGYLSQALVGLLLWKQYFFGGDVTQRVPDIRTHAQYKEDCGRHVRSFHFDVDLSSAIMNFSKQHGVSVHSLLLLLIKLSLEETATHFPNCPTHVRSLLYSTDMRKHSAHLSTSPLSAGAYVDLEFQNVSTPLDIDDTEAVVQLARKVNDDVRGRIAVPGLVKKLMFSVMAPLVRSLGTNVYDRLVSAVDLDMPVSLSNIGSLDTTDRRRESAEGDNIRLVEHDFTVSSPAPLFISTCTHLGVMRFCLATNRHWIDETFNDMFAGIFTKMSRRLIGQ